MITCFVLACGGPLPATSPSHAAFRQEPSGRARPRAWPAKASNQQRQALYPGAHLYQTLYTKEKARSHICLSQTKAALSNADIYLIKIRPSDRDVSLRQRYVSFRQRYVFSDIDIPTCVSKIFNLGHESVRLSSDRWTFFRQVGFAQTGRLS